jgi:hypothetical protein
VTTTVDQLLAVIDAAYDHKSWHGTNLRGSIRGMGASQAAWRPSPKRHNVWELVVHCAYWKYTAQRRLSGAKRGSFALTGSNWFERRDAGNDREWRQDIALLESTHKALRNAVVQLTPSDLTKTPRGSTVSNFALLSGIAAHDLYHAGQIQLLKRLYSDR